MIKEKYLDRLIVKPGKKLKLTDFYTGWAQSDALREAGKNAVKQRAAEILDENRAALAEAQELLWADKRYSILVILQGMDTAGKDGTIKHVMSGVNPQGCQVTSFGVPTKYELDHTFLWRFWKNMPRRGEIGIFNRSYYDLNYGVYVHYSFRNLRVVKRSFIPSATTCSLRSFITFT